MRISVAGHVCLDLLCEDLADVAPGQLAAAGPLTAQLGGTCANMGRAFAELGDTVDLACAVADDPLGRLTADGLREIATGDCRVQTVQGTASYSLVLDQRGSDRSFRHHVGANAAFDADAVPADGASWLCFGYPSLVPSVLADGGAPLALLFSRARAAGSRTLLDLAAAPADPGARTEPVDWDAVFAAVLPHVDLFAPSWDDLVDVGRVRGTFTLEGARQVGRWARGLGARAVLVSAGAEGSWFDGAGLDAGADLAGGADAGDARAGRHLAPAPAGPVVRTNAAGDTFKAVLVHELAHARAPRAAHEIATAAIGRYLAGRALRDTPGLS